MIGHWNRIVGRIAGRLWFWAVLHGALAVLTALAALALAPFISDRISADLGADAVEDILSILASSMLAVATFSLSTMVAAFGATTRTATPRAARLLIEDRIAQNAVATFVGAFIFGLVGIVALRAGLYGSSGRLVLFGVTILVIVGVVVTFFRWIDYLFRLGRLGEVISKVETVARASLTNHFRDPFLGARPAAAPPSGAAPVFGDSVGYLEYVDIEAVDRIAARNRGRVHVACRPGAFLDRQQPLGWCTWSPDEAASQEIREAFRIGDERSFRQDSRFGLIVLGEIATRALSSGVNDPGTAIDVLGRIVRLLSEGVASAGDGEGRVTFDNVGIVPLDESGFIDDTFGPIGRDAAAITEVQVRIQKALLSLAGLRRGSFREPIRRQSRSALERAERSVFDEDGKASVRHVAARVEAATRTGSDPGATTEP